MDERGKDVASMLGTSQKLRRQKEIEERRSIVDRIIQIIKIIAKLNMPFRGHNMESAKHLSDQNDYRFSDENHGVFIEILKFSADLDPVLSRHVQTIAMKASAS